MNHENNQPSRIRWIDTPILLLDDEGRRIAAKRVALGRRGIVDTHIHENQNPYFARRDQ